MTEPLFAIFAGLTVSSIIGELTANCLYDTLKFGADKSSAALRKKLNQASEDGRIPTNHTIERGLRRAAICATLSTLDPIKAEDLASLLSGRARTPADKREIQQSCEQGLKRVRKLLTELKGLYRHDGWDRQRRQNKLNMRLEAEASRLGKAETGVQMAQMALARIAGAEETAGAEALSNLMLELVFEVTEWPVELIERLREPIGQRFFGDDAVWPSLFPLFFAQEMKDDPSLHVILVHQRLDWNVEAIERARSDITNFLGLAQDQGNRLMHEMSLSLTALSSLIEGQAQQDRTLSEILAASWLLSGEVHATFQDMFRNPETALAQKDEGVDSVNRFHYAARGDEFLGRKDQLRQIEEDFLAFRNPLQTPIDAFRWMVICGDAGTGKSRLAQEIITRNAGQYRLSGFASDGLLNERRFGRNKQAQIQHPVLIVVDYTAGHQNKLPEFIKGWADYARDAVHRGGPPVRIILLLRRPDERVLHDIRSLGGNSKDALITEGEMFGPEDPMLLGKLNPEDTVALMRARILKTAESHDKDPIDTSDEEALRSGLKRFDREQRPLFAIMVAHAMQRGTLPGAETGEDQEAARMVLFARYLRGQWQNSWRSRTGQFAADLTTEQIDDIVSLHANLMRICTACGGADRADVLEMLKMLCQDDDDLSELLPSHRRRGRGMKDRLMVSMAGGRGAMNGGQLDRIPSLEPDLIGERFVLTSWEDFQIDAQMWCSTDDVVKLAWRLDPARSANFLRLATLDYPRSMHEASWNPVALNDEADARARARLLRNICLDTSYFSKSRWLTGEEMTRLFDICDLFDEELAGFVEKDPKVRGYYGQVLKRVTNVAANVVNRNIIVDDVETSAAGHEADVAISRRFSGLAGMDVTTVSTNNSEQPSADLISVVVERLPILEERVLPFLSGTGSYEERDAFVSSVTSIFASVYWAMRDKREEGGYWPKARSEKETAYLAAFRDLQQKRLNNKPDSDEITTASCLLISTSYAEWDVSASVYRNSTKKIGDALDQIDKLPLQHAGKILSFVGNFMHGVMTAQKKDNPSDATSSVELVDRIFQRVTEIVVFDQGADEKHAREYYNAALNLVQRRLDESLFELLHFPRNIMETLIKQVESVEPHLKIGANLLTSLSVVLQKLPSESERDAVDQRVYETMLGLVIRLLETGVVDADGFRVPSYTNMSYVLAHWVLRAGSENICLGDAEVARLIDLLEKNVGEAARSKLLNDVSKLHGYSPEVWQNLPGEALSPYFKTLWEREGPSQVLSEAVLVVWGHFLLTEKAERVVAEINALLPDSESGVDESTVRNMTLGLQGITLLASGFTPADKVLDQFGNRVRQCGSLGRNGAVRLYQAGVGNKEAVALAEAHDMARTAAFSALARNAILAGGSPDRWLQDGDT